MVLCDRALCRVLPPMAPTTRSARLSIEAQGVNYKAASSSKAIVVDELGEGFREESSLKVYKAKAIEKPGKGAQRRGRIGVKKEKKVASVDPDMEDFCSSAGSLVEPSFSEIEVMEIRTSLLSWYDRNHRVLPWRINLHSSLESPSYSGGEPDGVCKEVFRGEAKKEASPSVGLRGDSVQAAVCDYYLFPHLLCVFCDRTFLGCYMREGSIASQELCCSGACDLICQELLWCCRLILKGRGPMQCGFQR
jgi:hypothetical protein